MSSATSLEASTLWGENLERYTQLSALVVIIYEFCYKLDDEIELFWKKRMSLGTCLFLWNRYLVVTFIIVDTSTYFLVHPSFRVSSSFTYYRNTCIYCLALTVQGILFMRVYVMYSRMRSVLSAFVLMILVELAYIGYCAYFYETIGRETLAFGTFPGEPGIDNCAVTDSSDRHVTSQFWVMILVAESVLFALTLFKAWQYYRSGLGTLNKLQLLLVKGSISYFMGTFFIYLANAILWTSNKVDTHNLIDPYAAAIPAMLSNRLMISLRTAFYDSDSYSERYQDTSHLSFNARNSESLMQTGVMSTLLAEGYDESLGV